MLMFALPWNLVESRIDPNEAGDQTVMQKGLADICRLHPRECFMLSKGFAWYGDNADATRLWGLGQEQFVSGVLKYKKNVKRMAEVE